MDPFGPYEVLQHVATGSTATVYRAQHADLGRVVAIKQLNPQLLATPGALERFRAEAQVLSGMDDPHVVAVYDFVEEPGRVWLAEEWVVGATLQAVLEAHGMLSPEQALGAVRGALQGLAYAHDRGLVHRDVSTGNVLTDLAGSTKLVDFGLAAPVGATGACGTPAFVSPEAARGEAVGKPGDVYSSGAVLFLLLSGALPFPAATADAVLQRHVNDAVPTLRGPPPLAAVLSKAMAKDPAARQQDAAELLADLEDAAERSYGPDWLGRAALGSLVVATVELGLGTAGPAVEEPPTAVTQAALDTGPGPAAPAVHPRRRPRKTPALIAAAVVLVGAGTATAVTLTSKKTTPRAAPRASAPPSPTPTPLATPSAAPSPTPTPLLAVLAPHGTYALSVVLTSSDNPIQPVGTRLDGTWTVVTTCTGVPCTGTITSTSGAVYTTTWDGTTLTAKGTRESPCLNRSTGSPISGTDGAYHEDISGTLTATPDPKDPATTLSGVFTAVQTLVHPQAACTGNPPTHQTRQTVIRRVSR